MLSTEYSSSTSASAMAVAAAQQNTDLHKAGKESAELAMVAREEETSVALEQADDIAQAKDQDASSKAYEILLSNVKEHEVRSARQAEQVQGNNLRLEIQAYLQQEDDQRMVDEIV